MNIGISSELQISNSMHAHLNLNFFLENQKKIFFSKTMKCDKEFFIENAITFLFLIWYLNDWNSCEGQIFLDLIE